MTMTETQPETAAESRPVSVTFERQAFAEIASLAALCANDDRPLLAGVRLVITGGSVTGVATDSYVLARMTREAQTSAPAGEFIVPAKFLVAVAKAAKPPKRGNGYAVTLTFHLDGCEDGSGLVNATWGPETGLVGGLTPGRYPSVDNIITDWTPFTGYSDTLKFAISPAILGKLSKVYPWNDRAPFIFERGDISATGSEKPCRIQSHDTLALIMGVRI